MLVLLLWCFIDRNIRMNYINITSFHKQYILHYELVKSMKDNVNPKEHTNIHQSVIVGIFSGLVISWVTLFSNFLTEVFFPFSRLLHNVLFSLAIASMFIFVILYTESRFMNKINKKKNRFVDFIHYLFPLIAILLVIVSVIYFWGQWLELFLDVENEYKINFLKNNCPI